MTIPGDAAAFLAKTEESLAGAEREFADGRYNNCANRSYYACFQAAITALIYAGIQPRGQWDHSFVQAEFGGRLVYRRKLYPAELRDVLSETFDLRCVADYDARPVTRTRALRAIDSSRSMLRHIREGGLR